MFMSHNAAHIVHNSISGLTPFTYFRIIVSLEVTVGVSCHKLDVKVIFWRPRSSSFLGEVISHLKFWVKLFLAAQAAQDLRNSQTHSQTHKLTNKLTLSEILIFSATIG